MNIRYKLNLVIFKTEINRYVAIMDNDTDSYLIKQIKQIAQWIVGSKHLVAFTGAGISTNSGIPDFRGPDGVWTRRDKGLPPPKMKKRWSEVKPNSGHLALVRLQELGLLKFLITQNTDNLHLESGISLDNIAELHGNGSYLVCLECDRRISYEVAGWDKNMFGAGYRTSPIKPDQPNCPDCSGRLISSVVNFGDPMPEAALAKSTKHSENADVYLILGSSLVVFPAADLPKYAIENGAKVIIVNKGKTPLDDITTMKLETDLSIFLEQLMQEIDSLKKKKD